ncbi:MAG: DUF58 domain-containing protein [Kutzneria sp.]|nr:DUF58 domain-containing protein [Kutzneria sp.]MBV9844213.1 DUF58 domain-containing protein [Kutzneria sp.]
MAAGVAAAACSVVLNERDLLRIAVFAVLLPVLSALLAARARIGLTAERKVVPHRVPVGAGTEVRIEIAKAGRLPGGGLLLEDGVSYLLGSRPRFVVDRLSRRRVTSLRYQVRPTMRGVQQVGPLTARVTDPFGMAEFDRQLLGNDTLVVVPRVTSLVGTPAGSGADTGATGSARLRSGQGTDDAVVRPYRHGDELRKVHWRSTAHRDELMVRIEERPRSGGTTVLLDHRASAHRGAGPTSSLEWAVSFAASVCLHLRRNGRQVRLSTVDETVLVDATRSGGLTDVAVLDSLAALKPTAQRGLALRPDPAVEPDVVAVFGATSSAEAAELSRLRSRTAHGLAVLLDVSAWGAAGRGAVADDTTAAKQVLRGCGWSVAVARPDTPPALVWGQLCQASGSPDRDLPWIGEVR